MNILWITFGLIGWFLLSIPLAFFMARVCALSNRVPSDAYESKEAFPAYLPK